MKKKRYIKPDFQIIKIEEHDLIATSPMRMRMYGENPFEDDEFHVYGQW